MANNPHLLFLNPAQPTAEFRYRSRFPRIDQEDDEPEPDYRPMADVYQRSVGAYGTALARRIRERTIQVPAHIFYIDIQFFGTFHSKSFDNYYRANFGISPIKYYQFNSRIIFAITNEDRFNNFLRNINLFIETHNSSNPEYDNKIKFVKSFQLLTTEDLLNGYQQNELVTYLNLTSDLEIQTHNSIKQSLVNYLRTRRIIFIENVNNQTIEIVGLQRNILIEILENFDIIHSVNSTSSGIIRPTRLGLEERAFPFEIVSAGPDSLVVGIIDTGISDLTGTKRSPK